jgi:hypothetical protein
MILNGLLARTNNLSNSFKINFNAAKIMILSRYPYRYRDAFFQALFEL